MTRSKSADGGKVVVWDLPTRLFHWLLAGMFAVAWFTHEDDRYLDVHVFAGYVFFGLLLFRMLWGFVGGYYARFREFGYRWTNARDYLRATLRGPSRRYLGHNPAGSWVVFLMLGLGLAISFTGMFVLGAEERHGPFAGAFSFAHATLFHLLHEASAVGLLVVVAFHLTGVAYESWRHRENLAGAMVTGRKRGPGVDAVIFRGVGALLLAGVAVSAIVQFAGHVRATPEKPYLPFTGPTLPDSALWRAECGSCHLAFHPTLLPLRSWEALLAGQRDHFGDDLALDAATLAGLRDFYTPNAAESALTEAAWKTDRSIPPGETPLRITETEYWKRKHRDISQRTWERDPVRTKANCAACHLDAEQGTFEDAAMRPPGPQTDQSRPKTR